MATEMIDAIPLSMDTHGVYRVGDSRVTLDLIVRAFNRGATPEEIVQDFPSVQLSDIYQVIDYYLKHGSELAEYFDRRNREEQETLEAHPGGVVTSWPWPAAYGPPCEPVKWLADENFRNAILRGLLRRSPAFDIVRAQDIEKSLVEMIKFS